MSELYKITDTNGAASHGGTYTYDLPQGDTPGAWTPKITNPKLCVRGFHVTSDPMQWIMVGARVWEVETLGLSTEVEDGDRHKRVASSIRLVQERPNLIPDWWRSVEDFIGTIGSINFLDGHGDVDPAWAVFETGAAAQDAAWAASRDATQDAAWDAAQDAAQDAAWAAARVATRVAARVAWDAARVAARDVAWSAAQAAARDATRVAARDVAQDAAQDAAWSAAWDVARDAARVAARAVPWAATRAATQAAARDAAWAAAWAAAQDAIQVAAQDAALVALVLVCDGLPLDQKHIDHVWARWRVWQAGYGVVAAVDDVLFCYRKVT